MKNTPKQTDYNITIKKILGELHITAEKVTPALLVETYKKLKEKIKDCETTIENYNLNMKMTEEVEKITPNSQDLEDKIYEYEELIKNYDIDLKTNAINERFRAYRDLKDRFKENKRQIKSALKKLIDVKPGSALSKLLRLDYLPYPPEGDKFEEIAEIRQGKRF